MALRPVTCELNGATMIALEFGVRTMELLSDDL